MVGRTNALVHPLVSSVNGMSGVVVLTPGDISYDGTAAYSAGSLGEAVHDASQVITTAQIDSLYTDSPLLGATRSAPPVGLTFVGDERAEEQTEEQIEELTGTEQEPEAEQEPEQEPEGEEGESR